jgi:glutamate-5-semialdehyde dehydrogenase
MSLQDSMNALGKSARAAAHTLSLAPAPQKKEALIAAAAALRARVADITAANDIDMKAGAEKGLSKAMLDRLLLTPDRVEAMAAGVASVAELDDPVGKELEVTDRPNGLRIRRVAVPLGVIGIIYESRPNVTADAAALCLKAGNAAILRGGSDSFNSSGVILECMQEGLRAANLPAEAMQRVPDGGSGCRWHAAAHGGIRRCDRSPRGQRALSSACRTKRVFQFSRIWTASTTLTSTRTQTWPWPSKSW